MVICADTSFLFSLYGNDCHSPAAADWIGRARRPILISTFNDFELRNALRFAEFSKRTPPGTSTDQLSLFRKAIADGRIVEIKSDLFLILSEAKRLSLAHTLTGGHRGFDILHVAAAKTMECTHFLTFDANQRKLAENEGLAVPL